MEDFKNSREDVEEHREEMKQLLTFKEQAKLLFREPLRELRSRSCVRRRPKQVTSKEEAKLLFQELVRELK